MALGYHRHGMFSQKNFNPFEPDNASSTGNSLTQNLSKRCVHAHLMMKVRHVLPV